MADANTVLTMKPNEQMPSVLFKGIVQTDTNLPQPQLKPLTKETSFSIQIHSITEYDIYDNVVNEYLNDTHNINGSVTVRVDMFTEQSSVEWAGDTMAFAPGSTKYTIRFDKYRFSSSLNHLEVAFQTVSDAPCVSHNEKDIEWGESSPQDMHYFLLPQHQLQLYGRFSNKAIIDDRIHSSSNRVINLDPDFSILVDVEQTKISTDECGNSTSDKSKPYLIPVVIVASIVGATIIIAVGVIALKKTMFFRTKMHAIRLKKSKRSLGDL
eukprot:gene2435-2768_t